MHSLTDEAMDRMVRLFEFLGGCPSVVRSFRQYLVSSEPVDPATRVAPTTPGATGAPPSKETPMSLASLEPGQSAVVTRIAATGALRQRLLDMGILPETTLDVERSGPGGQPLWVRCKGARLALRRRKAASIRVRAAS